MNFRSLAVAFISFGMVVGCLAQEAGKGEAATVDHDKQKKPKDKKEHPINPMDTGGPRFRGGLSLPASCLDSADGIRAFVQDANSATYDKGTIEVSVPTREHLLRAKHALALFSKGSNKIEDYKEFRTRGGVGVSIFKRVAPAVVLVVVGHSVKDDFEIDGLGSGVVVDPRGFVVTNWHVVNGHSTVVTFLKPPSGAAIVEKLGYTARVVATNPTSDLALLKLSQAPPNLAALQFEDPHRIEVAEDIHIIGHPEGKLWSYTTGVISQVRDSYKWTYSDRSKHEAKVLQLQTAVNPGNSGGPVVDDEAKIIGLVAASTDAQNLNYAIAVDTVQQFVSANMIRTRAGESVESEVRSGKLSDVHGWRVALLSSDDLTVFAVGDEPSNPETLIAVFSDGSFVERCESLPDTYVWRSWDRSGGSVQALGTGAAPTQMSK